AGLERALDIVGLVGRRRRRQPERIGRPYADEIAAQVCHAHALPFAVSALWMLSAASRPCATEVTVRSSPPWMQSPPAHTFAMVVRPSPSTRMRPFSSSMALPEPLRLSAAKVWPMALN